MKIASVATRYGEALGRSISDEALMEKTGTALKTLRSLYQSNPAFRHALANPAFDRRKRAQLLDTALDACAAPDLMRRLFHRMLAANRIGLLPEVAAYFDDTIDDWLNQVEVNVVTAAPLTGPLERRIVESLERFTGKTIRLRPHVDPSIIGGLIVYMWGVYFDFSLRRRLERLKEELLAEPRGGFGPGEEPATDG